MGWGEGRGRGRVVAGDAVGGDAGAGEGAAEEVEDAPVHDLLEAVPAAERARDAHELALGRET